MLTTNADTNNLVYRDGDSWIDKDQSEITRNGLLSCGLGALSIYSLGAIGVGLFTPVGLIATSFAIAGVVMCGVDWVQSSETWDNEGEYLPEVLPPTVVEVPKVTLPPMVLEAPQPKVTLSDTTPQLLEPLVKVPKVTLPPMVLEAPQPKVTLDSTHRRPTAIEVILRSPYKSRAFFGDQRTGKSYFASVASENLSATGVRIYHLNLISYRDPDTGVNEDDEYWQHAYLSLCVDITQMDKFDAATPINAAIKLVTEWFRDSNPAILIVDEIAYLGSEGNVHKDLLNGLVTLIADKVTALSSSGSKRKKAIWTIAPEFVAGSMVQEAKSIKKLSLCYLTIHPEKTVDWQGQAITFSAELFDQIKRNYSIYYPDCLPDDLRVAYINKEWMSIGDLRKTSDSLPTPNIGISDVVTELTKQVNSKIIEVSTMGGDISELVSGLELSTADPFDNDKAEKILTSLLQKSK